MIDETNKEHIGQLQRDLREVFGTDAGRRVMDWLESFSGYSMPLYNGDKDKMMINEGKRLTVITLKNLLKWKAEQVVKYFKTQKGGNNVRRT